MLRSDANKYRIALDHHILGGSARAYLERQGLIKDKEASPTLDGWSNSDDGVQILLDKMQEYYDNDRFEVLKRRAENTLSKTREVLQKLIERYSTGELRYDLTIGTVWPTSAVDGNVRDKLGIIFFGKSRDERVEIYFRTSAQTSANFD